MSFSKGTSCTISIYTNKKGQTIIRTRNTKIRRVSETSVRAATAADYAEERRAVTGMNRCFKRFQKPIPVGKILP